MSASSLIALAGAGLLLSASAARPSETPGAWNGLWQGTVGTLPIRACFAGAATSPSGDYYYLSRLQLIALEGDAAQPGDYGEGAGDRVPVSRWHLEQPAQGTVQGTWTGRGRTLPIHLTRIGPRPTAEWNCAASAFHAARLAGVRVKEQPAALGSFSYTRLTLDHGGRFDGTNVETFRVASGGEAARRINAELLKPLGQGDGSWRDCVLGALEWSPHEGYDDEALEPTLVTRRWFVVRHRSDSYCGGAHPNATVDFLTFDRATGQAINPLDWLNDRAVTRHSAAAGEPVAIGLRPAFRAFLLGGSKKVDAECRQSVESEDYWRVELRRDGFSFSPDLPHAAAACIEEYFVPFGRLRPYLSSRGGTFVSELQGETAPGR